MRMVLVAFLFALIPLAAGCSSDNSAAPATGEITKISFTVENMMCEEACAASVRDILSGVRGVTEASVDFAAKTATCLVDNSAFDPAAAIAELDDKGFAATAKE